MKTQVFDENYYKNNQKLFDLIISLFQRKNHITVQVAIRLLSNLDSEFYYNFFSKLLNDNFTYRDDLVYIGITENSNVIFQNIYGKFDFYYDFTLKKRYFFKSEKKGTFYPFFVHFYEEAYDNYE